MDIIKTDSEKTIHDFGAQWTRYPQNDGYYASKELLQDIFSPFLHENDFNDKHVLDIGSGSGRIVKMLLNFNIKHIDAIEPSEAFTVIQNIFSTHPKVTLHHIKGQDFKTKDLFDLALSIGVLHHIPDPTSTIHSVYRALKPGGRFLVWLYGQEGNELYLKWTTLLRKITIKLPTTLLALLSWILCIPLIFYEGATHMFNLPMRDYFQQHLSKLTLRQKQLTIFDQLNPRYAKYYTKNEAYALLSNQGFVDIKLHHRHAYSWTVIGTKPDSNK